MAKRMCWTIQVLPIVIHSFTWTAMDRLQTGIFIYNIYTVFWIRSNNNLPDRTNNRLKSRQFLRSVCFYQVFHIFFINKWTIFKLFTQYNRTGLQTHTHTHTHHTTKLILCAAHDVNWNHYVLDNLCIQIKIKNTIIALHSEDSFVSAEIMMQNNWNERMIHVRMQFSKEILCFLNPFFVFWNPFDFISNWSNAKSTTFFYF